MGPGIRVYFLILAACVLAGLFAWLQYTNWQRAYGAANASLAETARAISIHIDDLTSIAEQQIRIIANEIQVAPEADTGAARAINKMRALVGGGSVLRSLAYADADGKLIYSTFDSTQRGMDVSGREYFQFHKSKLSLRPRLGIVAHSQTKEEWFLPITCRINNRDGSFAGVLLATISLSHFVAIFDTFNLGPDASFALIRDDGHVLLRAPLMSEMPGYDISASQLYKVMNSTARGNGEYTSPFDGVRRISGFFGSPTTGATVLIGQSLRSVVETWLSYTIVPALGFALIYIATIFFAVRWIRQMQLREEGEEQLAFREAELIVIAENSTDVIERINRAGKRFYVSPAAGRIYERPAQDLIGSNILEGLNERAQNAWQGAFAKLAAGSLNEMIRFERVRNDGTRVWLETALSCVLAKGTRLSDTFVAVTRDVTKQEMVKRELNMLATIDDLTGLLNKRVFGVQLKRRFAEMKKAGQPLSVALMDLDRFKFYNDTYGHVAGDKCLREVARVIREMLAGETAIAARFGGEELVILFPGYEEAAVASILEAIREAVEALAIPHERNLPWRCVTLSLGYATTGVGHEMTVDQLMIAADTALYAAKNSGRNALKSHASCLVDAYAQAAADGRATG
jgi:diguanylate cyclase (GGDEF)-like protein/PAS domain S-box-containing protein